MVGDAPHGMYLNLKKHKIGSAGILFIKANRALIRTILSIYKGNSDKKTINLENCLVSKILSDAF